MAAGTAPTVNTYVPPHVPYRWTASTHTPIVAKRPGATTHTPIPAPTHPLSPIKVGPRRPLQTPRRTLPVHPVTVRTIPHVPAGLPTPATPLRVGGTVPPTQGFRNPAAAGGNL